MYITENKKLLRILFKKRRNAIIHRDTKSDKITDRLLDFIKTKSYKNVMCFLSCGSEVNTLPLIKRLLSMGVNVSVPRCDENKPGIMYAVEIDSLDKMKANKYGILEPFSDGKIIFKNYIDCCIIPALAFDRNGFRLGYGGGYYDRFLEGFKGDKIGICFSELLDENIPKDDFDQRTDFIVTENEIITCR